MPSTLNCSQVEIMQKQFSCGNTTLLKSVKKSTPRKRYVYATQLIKNTVKTRKPVVFKVVLLGDAGVGKTSLVRRFIKNNFQRKKPPTFGVHCSVRDIKRNGKYTRMVVWDTSGSESILNFPKCLNSAQAVIVAFDCTKRASFVKLPLWLNLVNHHGERDALVFAICTKCEDHFNREVSLQDILKISKDWDIHVFETSSKSGSGVNTAFMTILSRLLQRKGLRSKLPRTLPTTIYEEEVISKVRTICCGYNLVRSSSSLSNKIYNRSPLSDIHEAESKQPSLTSNFKATTNIVNRWESVSPSNLCHV